MATDETGDFVPEPRPGDETRSLNREQLLDEVIAAYLQALQAGKDPDPQEWLARHPDLATELAEFFADRERMEEMARPVREAVAGGPSVGSKPRYIGDYELLEELGRGGMGVVYRARQVSLKRQVALKMILAGGHASDQDLARFATEAEAVARLQHPNIVQIHEIGEHEGRPYAALEFVAGGSLDKKLGGTPLPARQAAQLMEVLARAIHAAHQQGIVHRDLKPANVLLASSDRPHAVPLGSPEAVQYYEPKITDFGLAKLVNEEAGQTRSGAILGTPSYMAPEQAAGRTKEVGPAADVYALGAILYECLTGRPPFRAPTPFDTLKQVLSDDPVPPHLVHPRLSRDLETVCLKCLEKGPRRRYGSALELAEDLSRFLDGEPVKARRPGPALKLVRWATRQRRSVLLAASVATVTVLAVLIGLFGWGWYRKSQMGDLFLSTDTPAFLTAEILDEKGRHTNQRFLLPMTDSIGLPTGSYALRLSIPGRMSETVRFLIEAGQQHEFPLKIEGRYRTLPLKFPEEFEFVRPVADLQGDGQAALICAKDSTGDVVALSATTGVPLWKYRSEGSGGALDPPVVCQVDGQVIVILKFNHGRGPRVEGLDGKTGRPLWHFHCPQDGDILSTFRRPMEVIQNGERRLFLCPTKARYLVRDVHTGESAGPDLDLAGVIPDKLIPTFASLRSGGLAAAFVWREGFSSIPSSLVARELSTGKQLWEKNWEAPESDEGEDPLARAFGEKPGGLMAADLSGKGQATVVLAIRQREGSGSWVAVEALDGVTGEERWRHPLTKRSGKLKFTSVRLIAGPDLDGDGWREVFLASLYESEMFVDALSGKDGRALWWRRYPLFRDVRQYVLYPLSVGTLHWWGVGGDGWPQLVVPVYLVRGRELSDVVQKELSRLVPLGRPRLPEAQLCVLAAGAGHLSHFVRDAGQAEVADLDGDGLTELFWEREKQWHAVAGTPAESWRWLPPSRAVPESMFHEAGRWQPGADLDLDGVPDLLNAGSGRTPVISGRTGALLWPWPVAGEGSTAFCRSLPEGDLNGDGRPDVLRVYGSSLPRVVGRRYLLEALSAVDGQRLWEAVDFPMGSTFGTNWKPLFLDSRDLDGDGRPEVILVDRDPGADSVFVAVLSGQNGTTRWKVPLRISWQTFASVPFSVAFHDLNEDGTQDLALFRVKPGDNKVQLQALHGGSGASLWEKEVPGEVLQRVPAPRVAVLASGPNREPIVITVGYDRMGNTLHVTALAAANGQAVWRWSGLHQNSHDKLLTLVPFRVGPDEVVAVFAGNRRGQGEIVVLGADGRETARVPVSDLTSVHPEGCDLEGKGANALVFISRGKVHAIRGDGTPLWKEGWLLSSEPRACLGVHANGEGSPRTIWVRSGPTVYGLAGPDGKPVRRCDGPGNPESVLTPDAAGEPPRVLYRLDDGTLVCLLALPADPLGRYRIPEGTTRSYSAPLPDPRHERSLPWRPGILEWAVFPSRGGMFDQRTTDRLIGREWLLLYLMLISLLLGVVYWLVPFLLARVAWRRSMWLAPLPLVWLGLALWFLPKVPFFGESRFDALGPVQWFVYALIQVSLVFLGLGGLLVLLLMAWLGRCLKRRQRRRVLIFLAVWVVLTLGSGVLLLAADAGHKAEWEHYAWGDVYLLPALWLYPLSGLVLCGRFLEWLVRRSGKGSGPVIAT